VMIVECDCDEAIGMALASGVNIFMESSEWERRKISSTAVFKQNSKDEGIMDALPILQNAIESLVIEREGDGVMSQNTKIQTPRGRDADISFFGPSNENQPVFKTDIPVQSLGEFDSLTVQDKAQLLLSLDSFKGRLPRPRVLRDVETSIESTKRSKNRSKKSVLNPLDEMLLPLIDESVRRQILVRAAEERGDFEEVNELEQQKSRRQKATENAEIAKEEGNDELAAMWQKEADFYGVLRADATQDEGSYSSYLDRDEWYERTRQKIAEKNKKRFGSLLDGLE